MAASTSSCKSSEPGCKEYPIALMDKFIGDEIRFRTYNGECMFGKLHSYDSSKNTFNFRMLKDETNGLAYTTLTYHAGDLVGMFTAPIRDFTKIQPNTEKQTRIQQEMKNLHEDIQQIVIEYNREDNEEDNGEDHGLFSVPENYEVIVAPDSKKTIFKDVEFTFFLDQKDFEETIDNLVVRFLSPQAKHFDRAIEVISDQIIISVAVLPYERIDRQAPIDFVIIGCKQGSFVFAANQEIMTQLKPILESERICKVWHDGCLASARLYSIFQIDCTNVDDTLVLEQHLQCMHFGKTLRGRGTSYEYTVSKFMQISLPWAIYDHFYSSCGKGKLLANKLDETGRGYVRGLVQLLPELRMELIKNMFLPIITKNYCYNNIVKQATSTEYANLRDNNLINPQSLMTMDCSTSVPMNMVTSETLSILLIKKFSYFNRLHRTMPKDASTQTDPELKISNRFWNRGSRSTNPSSASSSVVSETEVRKESPPEESPSEESPPTETPPAESPPAESPPVESPSEEPSPVEPSPEEPLPSTSSTDPAQASNPDLANGEIDWESLVPKVIYDFGPTKIPRLYPGGHNPC